MVLYTDAAKVIFAPLLTELLYFFKPQKMKSPRATGMSCHYRHLFIVCCLQKIAAPITPLLIAISLLLSANCKAQQPAGENDANLSELLYRPNKPTAKVLEGNEASLMKATPVPAGTAARINTARFTKAPLWNQQVAIPLNRQLEVDNIPLQPTGTTPVKALSGTVPAFCTTPTVTIGCCWYVLKDEYNNKNVNYANPAAVFNNNESDARAYAQSLQPAMPFYVPFTNSNVYPIGGWQYDNGSGHGSVDYVKTSNAYGTGIDPTFGVYAAAPGRVVSTVWDDLNGNTVIIEHTAPNGTKYRTGYFHMRNGFDHDIQNAKKIAVKDASIKDARDTKYRKYAYMPNPSPLMWGTDAQKLKVKAGDLVSAGQLLGYSGNTGYGGAGWGLNPDGTFIDPTTGNNHLHFMLWIKSPNPATGVDWMEVDPYGVYSKIKDNTDCYDIGANSGFNRFFAPFYASFHNVPVQHILRYWGYYTGMGMALQTLSVHKKGSNYLASGSFQYGLPSTWTCRINMTADQYQQYYNQNSSLGFVPRQISVTNTGGSPLFTVIWRKKGANENAVAVHNIDDATWKARWKTLVEQQKMRVSEHVAYQVNGKRLHAAVFVNENPGGFYEYDGLSTGDFNKKFDDLHKAGYMTININAEELGNQTAFGGVWWPKNKSYYAFYNLSPTEYQNKFSSLGAEGYQLFRIQGYADSGLFSAIWMK
jgi:hypothetical protein